MNANLFDQLLDPLTDCLTPEAARRIAALRADDELQAQVDDWAKKANRGTLTDAERAEYDEFLSVYRLVSIMQAKARRLLKS